MIEYPFPQHSDPSFLSSDSIFPIFIFVILFFVIIMFICAISRNYASQNHESSLKYPTNKIETYLKSVQNDVIHPQTTKNKISLTPLPTPQKIFETSEIAVPHPFSPDEIRKIQRSNYLKFGGFVVLGMGLITFIVLQLDQTPMNLIPSFFKGGITYTCILAIYSRSYNPVISFLDPVETWTEKFIEENTHKFQLLDSVDVLYSWFLFQKKKLAGLFTRIPRIEELTIKSEQQAIFVETEAEAEHFLISHVEQSEPYSKTVNKSYFSDPFPVNYPKEFLNETQEFPCEGTLDKRQCEECDGSGEVGCSRCGGSGHVTCSSCGGWGYHEETRRDHDGRSETVRHSCSCSGGHVTCGRCGGSGRVTCPTCEGEGELGYFIVRRYKFQAWKKVCVFKETENSLQNTPDLVDLPNESSRLIYLNEQSKIGEMGNLGDLGLSLPDAEYSPTIKSVTIEHLQQKKHELEAEINQMENVLFDRYAYREFPEISMILEYHDKLYSLVARGYKPVKKNFTLYSKLPVSFKRIMLFYTPFLLWMGLIVLIFLI